MKQPEVIRKGGLVFDRYEPAEQGALPPLVILHGLFGSRDNWRSQARALAAGRVVLVPDMPNHGESVHTEDFSYHTVAQQLWQALDELDVPRAALLGHSMGGKAAMAMALTELDRCAALVVVDIAPRRYAPRHAGILAGMKAVIAAGVTSRSAGEKILAEHIPEKAVRLFLLKSLVLDPDHSSGGERYRWQMNLQGIETHYETLSAWPFAGVTWSGPALQVRGALSPYVSDEDTQLMRTFFPALRVETIADSGHWVHAEQRETFLSVVRGAVS